VTDSKVIDTSVWLDYFFEKKYTELIDSPEIIIISTLSLFEIKRKLYKNKVDPTKITTLMDFLHKKCLIFPVSIEIAERAVQLSIQYQLAAADAIIYATAQERKAQLITRDNDFRGLPEVTLLK